MSLQLVAKHLAQKGRGSDNTLVHMSNREVAGLQALAKKHGGQLSVNPDTGLTEAGFLDNILPAVAGAGLTYLSGGALSPLMSAGIVGGLTALDSKDLSKGLMAGLGAWGGGEMVGGLAGLGAAGADTAGMAAPEYQAAVGTGAGNFMQAPMASLSNLGGGSALKGSLPILAGLAPAAADMLGEEESDGAPPQHKGYIRKYGFDPETGQYKQTAVYEAGGDPNVDVSDKAGTAGAFGGVGKSDYQKAHGMAEGGAATDSSRVYDYLMGRGPNPMQFTHTPAPAATTDSTTAPITPTTPILEAPFDQYGNIQRGGGDSESRAAQQAEAAARMDKWAAEDPEGYAHRNDWVGDTFGALGTLLAPGMMAKKVYENFTGPDSSTGGPARYSAPPVTPNVESPFFGGYEASGATPNPYSVGPGTPGFNAPSYTGQPEAGSDVGRSQPGSAQLTQGYTGPSDGGSVGGSDGGSDGPNGPEGRGDPGGDRGGWGSGGGYAHGGLAAPHSFYHQGKFNYHGPQVYANGGGIADLASQYNLGSYSDGGRLLKGPGDGVEDLIPATIGHNQPARLANNEFVLPARIVSEIGNGSTDAGARKLYAMMDRVQQRRAKTVGRNNVAVDSGAHKEVDKL